MVRCQSVCRTSSPLPKGLVLLVVFVTTHFSLAEQQAPWLDNPDVAAEAEVYAELIRDLHDEESAQHAQHGDIPDTMYASTPDVAIDRRALICPVEFQDRTGVISRAQENASTLGGVQRNSAPRSPAAQIGLQQYRQSDQWTGPELERTPGDRTHSSVDARNGGRLADSSMLSGQNQYQGTPLRVPLVYSGTHQDFESLVQITNRSDLPGFVDVVAIDDIGQQKETLRLQLSSEQSIQFSALDLEIGNDSLGIPKGVGLGVGNWRLELYSPLALDASSYVQTRDGLVVSMHDTVEFDSERYQVATFFQDSEKNRVSQLRLTNLENATAEIIVESLNSQGVEKGTVRLQLLPGASTLIDSEMLQLGDFSIEGELGQSDGTIQLIVSSSTELTVMNLVKSDSGHVTNLSVVSGNAHALQGPLTLLSSFNSTEMQRGMVRLVNRSEEAGHVEITVQDEIGNNYPFFSIPIGGRSSLQLDAADLESGNVKKGIDIGLGFGYGDWQLQFESALNLSVASFVESEDGFISPVHDFNNLEDQTQTVWDSAGIAERSMRLTNSTIEVSEIEVVAIGNNGDVSPEALALVLDPGTSHTIPNQDLSQLIPQHDEAPWQLQISSSQPIQIHHYASSYAGRLALLSHTPITQSAQSVPSNSTTTDVTTFFNENIYSQVIKAKCRNCHVSGGPSGHTRLVFVNTGDDGADQQTNLQVFRSFLETVEDGADLILRKMRGVGHGGGLQFRVSSTQYKDMSTFLDLLQNDDPEPSGPDLSPATLLASIEMESEQRTLWRAALVLAGRIPSPEEYETLNETDGLRKAVRGLMQGPGFHEFLIRSANDRLLTDRDKFVISEFGLFVNYTNKYHDLWKAARESGNYREFYAWRNRTQYGVRREGLELIAHVVELDLPYTEVLTADYVMANPYSAETYGAETQFSEATDAFDFKRSEIKSYYRKCAGRIVERSDNGPYIKDPGSCPTNWPFAGLLTNKVFLYRYPTTATNRNRARSRWTYYHFLDLDIENSASRTTDPVALADTNNPTLKNSACTVCHAKLDPVAGAFQDFGEEGDYRDNNGGMDAIDYNYKVSLTLPRLYVNARTFEDRELVSVTESLTSGTKEIQLRVVFDDGRRWSEVGIDHVVLRNEAGDEITRLEIEDLDYIGNDNCGRDLLDEDGNAYAYKLNGGRTCSLVVNVDIPTQGTYTLEANVWVFAQSEAAEGEPAQFVMVPESFYRDGDTWYRDMRGPGFGTALAPQDESSIQWLAQQIIADQRFATSTVKFWWPAIIGNEVSELPTNENLPNYESLLAGISAQHEYIDTLAGDFRQGFRLGEPFNLRDLLTEIIVSPWFRAESISSDAAGEVAVALSRMGAKRLLTPEELSRKTGAVTGVQWGRIRDERWWRWAEDYRTSTLDEQARYRLMYGGIDSDGIIDRARDMNAVMAGVAKSHAAEVSCPVVMRELYLLEPSERYLFDGIEKWVSPTYEFGSSFEVTATSREDFETLTLFGQLPAGDNLLSMTFLNDFFDANAENPDRNIFVDTIRVKNWNGEVISTYDLMEDNLTFINTSNCNVQEDGQVKFYCEGSVELTIPIASTSTYTIEMDVWSDRGGDALPQLYVSTHSDTENSMGSKLIRSTLVDLTSKLLGKELTNDSEEIQDRYNLLVASWERNKGSGTEFNTARNCNWNTDYLFLDGIVEEPIVANYDENNGTFYHINYGVWNALRDTIDWSDPSGIATTWVVVLSSFLLDYEYLHL